MPQPAVLPEWDTNQTNVTPTVAAHKTDGWADDEIPPADEENYWKNLVYQWIAYFSGHLLDGDWEFAGNVDINGNLNVDGTSQFDGDANFASDIAHTFLKSLESGAQLNLATNMTWNRTTNGMFNNTGAGAFTFVGDFLPLRPGDRIAQVRCLLAVADNPTTVRLRRSDLFGVYDVISFNVTTGAEDSSGTPRVIGGGHTVLAGERYWWEVFGTAAGAFTTSIARLQVDYDHPV